MNAPEKLKDTLNLPKTNFPMRANAVVREPARMNHWETSEVYAKMQKKNQNGPSFVLHDGPPFTNGDVHVGTALNKILKGLHFALQKRPWFSHTLLTWLGLSWLTY
jgi:isoleucyl-tRNA synthetase